MASVLVTGGGGFIGSHITTKMVELGHSVRVMDNFSSGHRHNLAHLEGKIEVLESDICKPADCEKACADMEFVFHQAAIPSVPLSVDEPQPSHEANMNGIFNMLRAAAKHKVRRFVFAASSAAYGETVESPKHEGIVPSPLSPYAVQKLAGEHYCRAFAECFGLDTLAIRYFNVFGERQDPASAYAAAIPAFVSSIIKGESPMVYGDGEQTRDFTYIDNVVHGNVLAMDAEKTSGEAVNVACGGAVTVNAVIGAINSALGKDVPIKYVSERPGDVRHSCADISLARKLLGYEPQIDFEEGLRRAIKYYKTLA